MKSLFPEIPVLHGRRVVLRRITMNDLPAMQELVSSEKVYRWLPAFLYEKCGFRLAVHAVREDWGFPEPTLADKWVR